MMRRRTRLTKTLLRLAGALAILPLVFVAAACSEDESDPAGQTPERTGGSGGEPSGGSGGTAEPASGGSGGSGPPPAGNTLCAKYGGPDVIMQVMQENVLGEIAADCRIQAFFAPLHPEFVAHIGECLGIQAQELFGCPSVVYAGSSSSSGRECRDMKTAHAGIGISDGDFDALIEDVVAGLSAAGVEEADIMAAAPALLGMKSDIVEVSRATPTKSTCERGDSGAGDAAVANPPPPSDASTGDGG